MWSSILRVVVIGLLMMVVMAPASAIHQCEKRSIIVDIITEQYGVKPRGFGMVSETDMMELYVADTGAWFLLLSKASGETCIAATGRNWVPSKPFYV